MTGMADTKAGVKDTTGAETTKNGIRNEGGVEKIVILVIKRAARPCRDVLQDTFLFCGRHKSAPFAWCDR